MRHAFAHNADLEMAATGDSSAPGAAITVALCGHWEHEPPCPLAPHHSRADRDGDTVHVRTIFAVEPSQEEEVHHRIDQALRGGELCGPDGVTTHWDLLHSAADDVLPEEAEHAERLVSARANS